MRLKIIDNPNQIIFSITDMYGKKVINQEYLQPPFTKARLNSKKQEVLNKYTEIVLVDYKQFSFTRDEAKRKLL